MKYDLEVNIEEKPAEAAVFIRAPEPLVREFKYICKNFLRRSQAHVLTQILTEFVETQQSIGKPKQKRMF